MKLNDKKASRCAIFVFYDKYGIVDRYITFFLEGLKKCVDRVIVVCNGELNDAGMQAFKTITDEVIVRPNVGYDVTAYKCGLEHISFEKFNDYDEILLTNSTMFGPIYPFEEMFEKMDEKDLDFWGMTVFHKHEGDPFGTIEYGYIPKHIQSFFMVFRKSLTTSEEFKDFWKTFPEIKGYKDAVGKFETVFTKKIEDKGFKWDVYCNSDELEGYTYEPMRDYARYLIEEKRCPIMKKRAFFQDYEEAFSRSGGETVYEAFNYIDMHTDYDVDMIWETLLRLQNMADIKKRLHLNYILSSHLPINREIESKKVALIVHVYYEELAEFCAGYAANMPDYVDIYVTAPNEEKLKTVKAAFDKLNRTNIDYRVVGNIGRDVAPFLVGCKDVIDKYDIICKVHDKKVYQVKPMSIGGSWGYKCFENTLKNRVFIENVIKTFEDNPRLGILTPPVPNHGPYYPTTGKGEWGDNFDATKELAEQLNINVDMVREKEPIAPLGSMFWFRTKSLKTLFDHDWQYSEFPEEPIADDSTVLHAIERLYPFCAQHEGYYSGWLMVDSYARIEMTNYKFINDKLVAALKEKVGNLPFNVILDAVNQK